MFKNTFQSGFLSILYSIGSKPLQIWDSQGDGNPDMSRDVSTVYLVWGLIGVGSLETQITSIVNAALSQYIQTEVTGSRSVC